MVAEMNSESEPQLAPPGAGLPKIELLLGRFFFALRCKTGHRKAFNARFSREREAIAKLVAGLAPENAALRILIPRLAGLEDSSRYWSVWMTLDHLRIVNLAIASTIEKLDRGETPAAKASTAAVKPSSSVDAGVVAQYESACDVLLSAVAGVGNLKTELRYAHPWFGPLDAFQWHAMAGGHMGIHRAQLERICASFGQGTQTPSETIGSGAAFGKAAPTTKNRG